MVDMIDIDRTPVNPDTATTIAQVKAIRDQAEAARLHARQSRQPLDTQNGHAELRIRAERKAGLMLSEMDIRPGNPQLSQAPGETSHDSTIHPRLSDLGITRDQSSRWTTIAGIPGATFEEYVEETKRAEKELTTSGLLTLAKRLREEKRNESVESRSPEGEWTEFQSWVAAGNRFGTILVNVAWQGDSNDGAPTMAPEEIARIILTDIMANDACLFFWVPSEHLSSGLEILSGWGFRYVGTLVYREPKMDGRTCWLVADRLLLLGVRGSDPFREEIRRKWKRINRGKYGEDVWGVIKKVSPRPWGQMGHAPQKRRSA